MRQIEVVNSSKGVKDNNGQNFSRTKLLGVLENDELLETGFSHLTAISARKYPPEKQWSIAGIFEEIL